MTNKQEHKPVDLTQFEGHTEGPWEAFQDEYAKEGSEAHGIAYMIGFSDYPRFSTIAKVRHGATDEEYGGKKAIGANAKLMAAAPSLAKEVAMLREALFKVLDEGQFYTIGDFNDSLEGTSEYANAHRLLPENMQRYLDAGGDYLIAKDPAGDDT